MALSAGIVLAVAGTLAPVPFLLALTTFGTGASLVPRLRGLRAAFVVGEYALLAFCAAVGSLVDLRQVAASSPVLILLCLAVMGVALAVHAGLARLFRIDADTVLITSTAAIFGPALVPAIARATATHRLLAAGVALGLLGFAIGTYAGLLAAWVLGG